MTNITFSIENDIHKRMKAHPEIKWTEILRQAILEYLTKIEEPNQISVKELRTQLDSEMLHEIDSLDINKEITFYESSKKLESDRMKHLLKLERGSEE